MNTSLITNIVNINNLEKYAAIIGEKPSTGARSPKLWNAVFRMSSLNYSMVPLDVTRDNIVNLLDSLNSDESFIGGAIAAPYKEVVLEWLDGNATPEANNIGAVNCLYRDVDGKLMGTNTDGEASLATFNLSAEALTSKSVMILGIGGAGKAVASYFSPGTGSTIIISRSDDGKSYADKLNVKWANWLQIDDYLDAVDVVINCTSLGFGSQENKSPLSKEQISRLKKTTIVYDIIYQPQRTPLLDMSEKNGLLILNGLNMNLEQAVLAYKYAVKTDYSLEEIRIIMAGK